MKGNYNDVAIDLFASIPDEAQDTQTDTSTDEAQEQQQGLDDTQTVHVDTDVITYPVSCVLLAVSLIFKPITYYNVRDGTKKPLQKAA